MTACGGCQGKGSHRFTCPKRPGYDHRLVLAQRAEDLGDQISGYEPHAANLCWAAAGRLRELVSGSGHGLNRTARGTVDTGQDDR